LNVIYVLNAALLTQRGEKRTAVLEELEALRAFDEDKNVLIRSMFRTADTYAFLKHWDKALAKSKEAVAISDKEATSKKGYRQNSSGSIYSLGNQFESGKQLAGAAELYSMAYAASIKEGSDEMFKLNAQNIEPLLKDYKENHDTAAGAAFLKNLLNISIKSCGPDNTFTREWLIRLSTFYLQNGDKAKGNQIYDQLAASIFKPGMTVSKENQDSLASYADLLNMSGMRLESGKIKNKLKSLEQQHCKAD